MKYIFEVMFGFAIFVFFISMPLHADTDITFNTQNGHFYQRIDQKMKWLDAKSYCENIGAHLATIS